MSRIVCEKNLLFPHIHGRRVDGPPVRMYRAGEVNRIASGFGMFFILAESMDEKEAISKARQELKRLNKLRKK